MADVSVSKFNSAGTESFSTIRKTGWFSLSDLSKNVLVRRLNARYDSSDDVSVNIYADGDSDSPVWTGTMPKNGETGATLSSSATDSDTTLDVTDTSKITSLDKILVDKEIMSVQDLVTNGTFDTDTTSWDSDSTTTLSVSSNKLRMTAIAGSPVPHARAFQGFTTVVGKVYRVTGNFIKGSADEGKVAIANMSSFGSGVVYAGVSPTMTSDTAFDFTFTSTQITHYILLHDTGGQDEGDYTEWDNISIICTTQLKVARGENNTQNNAHSSGAKVYYGHKKWDSLRVGRRAKYMSVQISTGASTNSVEINKLEFVTDGAVKDG